MPSSPPAERLRRVLVLVPWVIANEGVPVDEVCKRFDITEEELAEDLQLLIVCGLPPFGPGDLIWADMEGGRVVIDMADYLAQPPRLTRAEALALLIMGRAAATLPGVEEADALRSALAKLAGAVAPAQQGETSDLAARVEVEMEQAGAQYLGEIRRAIDERRSARIVYYSRGREELTERTIDPLLLFGAEDAWYVRAHDHDSAEQRLFRVDRIKQLTVTDARFEPPPDFDARPSDAGPLFTASARDFEAVIELQPRALWMLEAVVHDRVERREDGSARVTLRTPHLAWLVSLLLSVGGAARAIEPPELVDAVRSAATRALARYSA